MREVDLELDFCPKCAPEETQNPFPVQEHRFYNSFAAVVQCTRCGTHYAASPRFGIIIITELLLVVLGELFLSEQLELSAYNDRVISSGPDTVCFYRDFAPPIWDMASDFRK